MRSRILTLAMCTLVGAAPALAQNAPAPAPDPVNTLVGRLDLKKYKATIKGLT